MQRLAISTLIVSAVGTVMLTQALVTGIVLCGLGMYLGLLTLTRMPSETRGELLHEFRVPILLALAALGGLLMMALGPNVPHPWRTYVASFELVVAFAFLTALSFKFVQAARRALRRS